MTMCSIVRYCVRGICFVYYVCYIFVSQCSCSCVSKNSAARIHIDVT